MNRIVPLKLADEFKENFVTEAVFLKPEAYSFAYPLKKKHFYHSMKFYKLPFHPLTESDITYLMA